MLFSLELPYYYKFNSGNYFHSFEGKDDD